MSPILEMRGITKTFPGVKALDNVNLAVQPGEIHAICGENGAGKSTLMKVLSGVYPHGSYTGDIVYQGQPVQFRDIRESEHLGIIIIHQELALVPLLSIAENIFLGNETSRFGVIDWDRAFARTRELLAIVGLDENPETLITNLGVGKQQLVEIAKALSKEVKLLILDEPTSSLNESDSQKLLNLLLGFKARGISSILISHKLNEISKVADQITILRDGSSRSKRSIATERQRSPRTASSRAWSAATWPIASRRASPHIGETPARSVRNWTAHHHRPRGPCRGARTSIFKVNRKGEIVGIAGLMGAGPHRARHEHLRPQPMDRTSRARC